MMNERLRKLAKQAYNLAVAESTNGQHECTVGSDYFLALKDQKFAELIVKECATLAYEDRSGILDHFGVE